MNRNLLLTFLLLPSLYIFSQNNVGIGTNTPDASAKLDVVSTDKGILIPRVSLSDVTTGSPISSPATGLMVWNTNASVTGGYGIGFYYWGGTAWTKVATGNALAATLSNGTIWIGNASNAPTEQTISGDITIDNLGVATVQDNSVDGTDIQISANATGDLMMYNGTDWVVLVPGTSGFVLTSNGSGVAPTYQDPNNLITKRDVFIASGSGMSTTAVTLADNTDQVVGTTDMSIKVKYNALSQDGVVSGPTASNPRHVWSTDVSGNPSWQDPANLVDVQNGLNINTTAPNASATNPYLELGGSLIRNTTIAQGAYNYIQNLDGSGTYDIQDGSASVVLVDASGNVTINNSSGTRTFKVVGDNDANLFNTSNSATNGDKVIVGASTADNSAKFQVDATNKGILIPRVTLTGTTDATTIATPATSLLVYNTTAAGTGASEVFPGYYYNAGTSASPNWVRFANGRTAWETTGNYGTVATSNYIGTNDAQDFVIRTNTSGTVAVTNERVRISSGGNVIINDQNNNTLFRVEGDNDANLLNTINGASADNDKIAVGVAAASGLQKFTVNNSNTTVGTQSSYPFGVARAGTSDYTIGSDASFAYNQSWNSKPLLLNSQGNFIAINKTSAPVQNLDINGRLNVSDGVIQRGTTQITGTSDLGLYSQISGNWIRLASNGAPIKFFTDQGGTTGVGTNATLAVDNANGGGVMIAAESGGTGNAGSPYTRAALDISSTTKGMLVPRLTTAQRDAMGNTQTEGLLIYNTSNDCFEYWDTKSTPSGGNGFWNSLCKWCDEVIVISTNQTGYNLASSISGGAKAKRYCVYINSGVTLQAASNGGGSGAAGNPGFNASTMPSGASVTLYNYGNILAGGGNGGSGSRESDAVCEGDICPGTGGAGGHAVVTNSNVPITMFNYGTVRGAGGGGGGGGTGCCNGGGGGGGGAGTPAGTGGASQTSRCASGTICFSFCGRTGASGAGSTGTATTGGTGGGPSSVPTSGCGCSNGGGTGGAGGNSATGGNNGTSTGVTTACSNGAGAAGGAAGKALEGNNSGSSLTNISGTVTGTVSP